jgi:hypothetical protein
MLKNLVKMAVPNALNPAPACGAVVEFLVAAQLVRSTTHGLAGSGAVLQGLEVEAQRAGGSDAEDEIDTLGAAEIQHFGRAVVAAGAKQAAKKVSHLAPGGIAGWV